MAFENYCQAAVGDPWHGPYHETDYGYPVRDDAVLFERLVLEINQAGLSWLTILKKRQGFRVAFDQFDIDRVAAYGEAERARLLADSGIIRNRRKIDAAIENARRLQVLRRNHGSFAAWLAAQHPRDKAGWLAVMRAEFVFMGGEVVGEFLMSIGYLPGAHRPECPVQAVVAAQNPPWMLAVRAGFPGYGPIDLGFGLPESGLYDKQAHKKEC